MKLAGLAFVLLAGLSWVSAGPALAAGLDVIVGTGRLVHLDQPAKSVFVADPSVADIEVRSPRLVYLFGRRTGETNLMAVDGNDRIILSERVSTRYDENGLMALLARLVPGSRINVETVEGVLLLSGRVATAADAADAVDLARRFLGPDAKDTEARIINRLVVNAPTQISLRVRIAEVSRDVTRQLGFNWEALGNFGNATIGLATGNPVIDPGAIRGFSTRNNGADSLFGRLQTGKLDINGVLDALDERGLVTILAEPNLTALSGVEASFLAGGEYPIPVPQADNVITIEYKRYGVSLGFVATLGEGNRIRLNVKPEVSQLTNSGALSLNGITVPALTTRRVETTVDLMSGQSFAIAGLLQSGDQKVIRKFPGLGDIPILGELFRSRRFERNETELVVIVTPFFVQPVDKAGVHVPMAESF